MPAALTSLSSSRIIDATVHFESHRGRRIFPEKTASQILFGDPTANGQMKEKGVAQRQAQAFAPVSRRQQQQQRRTTRRPRGPGTAFAAHIEANGFPAAASRRSACVDVAPVCLYQYDTSKLHTHKRLAEMPNREKQCDHTLQLFLRPEDQMARSAAAVTTLGKPRDGRWFSSLYSSLQAHEHSIGTRNVAEACKGSSDPFSGSSPCNGAMASGRRAYLPHMPAVEFDDSLRPREAASTDRLRLLEHLWQREYDRLYGVRHSSEENVDAPVQEDARARHGQASASAPSPRATAPSFSHVDGTVVAIVPPQRRRAKRGSTIRDDGASAKYAYPLQSRERQLWEREYACGARASSSLAQSATHASAPIADADADVNEDGSNGRDGANDDASENSSGNGMPTVTWRRAPSSPSRRIADANADAHAQAEARADSPTHGSPFGSRIAAADAHPPAPRIDAWFAPLPSGPVASPVHHSRSGGHACASHSLRGKEVQRTGQFGPHVLATSPFPRPVSPSNKVIPAVRQFPPPPQRSSCAIAGVERASTPSTASACTQTMVTLRDVCTCRQSRTPSRQHWKLLGSAAPSPLPGASSAGVYRRDEAAPTLRDVCRVLNTSVVM
ncbi:hypothetical protein JIQ42_04748 [Leishmania sp. Namibia]|uniref:hypothetical protein n=1 Tax=Leishmania sp. Namibia TaxID=2802991 RepID=UPI001B4E2C25|nr:hypothetical protein JIQ42_04748 [Leishmania sp. Namibia]